MAAIIKTKATIAKRALTSFMSYGALKKGFWSGMVFNTEKLLNHIILKVLKSFF